MKLSRTVPVLVLALAASSLAWGKPLDSPERIARLGYVEGQIAFQAAQELATSALPDRPLIPGDRLVTEAGGRAELALGSATVRLDERTELSISTLDATTVRVKLNQGTASVHLRELFENEKFEVATPNTTLTLREPGEYRIAVPTDGTTDLTVRGGAAEAMTAGGPVRVVEGQRVRLEGRQALASLVTPHSADAFDEWVLEREVQLADLPPSPDEELGGYGEWYDEPSYGRVWMPSYAYGGYDPFRYGYWQSYGTSRLWVNSMPWGYHTFHSGRWAYLDHLNRWCWVPTRRHHRERDAPDTAPFGRPRRDDDRQEPVVTARENPQRIDGDRVAVMRRDVDSDIAARRNVTAPKVKQDPAPPKQNASASQSGTATMRPSRPSESRKEAPSSSTPATSREFGTPETP